MCGGGVRERSSHVGKKKPDGVVTAGAFAGVGTLFCEISTVLMRPTGITADWVSMGAIYAAACRSAGSRGAPPPLVSSGDVKNSVL